MLKKKILNKTSRDYTEKKELMEFDLKCHAQKHKWKMIEFEYLRESQRRHHECEMERQRIRNADVKKTIQMKQAKYYSN